MNTMFGRIHQRTIQQNYSDSSQAPSRMGFMKIRYSTPAAANPTPRQQVQLNMVNEHGVKSSATMTWGKPTWYFFHTMAEKIKPEEFSVIRTDLLEIIYAICTNLPCPDCANHAKTYLDKINFNTIQTRDDLKMMLFTFHNFVNQRKGYAIFSVEELNSLYGSAITTNIVTNFLTTYLKKNATPKMIANDMFRRRIVHKTKEWLKANSDKFLP